MNRVGNEDKDEIYEDKDDISEDFGNVTGIGTGYEAQNPARYMMMKIVVMMI
jgi:hypothetical protein